MVSGGEPLSQSAFTKKILEACKKEGLDTALETTGVGTWTEIEKVLKHVDLLLFDIKHIDSNKHQQTTGVKNTLLLENLRKASKKNKIWLRVPLIAGFNDSAEHIKKIATLGKEIDALKISLLPYHEGGKSKCDQLGRPHDYPAGKAPDDEHVNQLQGILEKAGLTATIGN